LPEVAKLANLHQIIASRVQQWREAGYPCDFPTLAEILEYQEHFIAPGTKALRFLRKPQVRALETYWYLRLVENTPHIFDLYKRTYPKQSELLAVLGLASNEIKSLALDEGIDYLWERIRTDDTFVHSFKLESLRETLVLDYPSYIFALAMGAGKTILIGAIIATEFAMAMDAGNGPFVENALVFAPGKTIIESLRELAEIQYDKILPPRLYKRFAASVKLTFTRDGEKDIPVTRGSSFNLVVTNTEKIRIQKETIRKGDIGKWLEPAREDEAKSEVANLRLQAIASLPHLAVFSDEAHHTYGQAMGQDLKRVRQTVDYLHQHSPNLICVINTTGTPYYERQPLKDVVIWYGLSEGIADDILKEVAGNIQAYSFDADSADQFVAEVVTDFFRDYGDVRLPNGAPAKLAIYFPQNDDLDELRSAVETALAAAGQSPDVVLKNTSESSQQEIDAFNRLNDPASPYRVMLLVNKGTEGWNCPSLFACALARKLKSSNNFVLQATTRCLRQVTGNTHKARIYLSMDNRAILDRQLQETYGETIADLDHAGRETATATLKLRKLDLPPLVVTQIVRTVTRAETSLEAELVLKRPRASAPSGLTRATFTIAEQQATYSVLQQVGETVTIAAADDTLDTYTAAVRLAALYRLDVWAVRSELVRLYGATGELLAAHLDDLARQIEEQTRHYTVTEERVDVALALVRPEGFNRTTEGDTEVYTAEIVYPKDKESLLLSWEVMAAHNPHDFGFHYTPYNFDSNPEKSFLELMLKQLNLRPDDIEDIYFTGALTDPAKTDFSVEYKDDKGKWRNYTPDFIIRKKGKGKKPGKCLIVEIKAENERGDPINGEMGRKAMALRRWEELNPDRLQYEMIFTAADVVTPDQMAAVHRFVE
jgi:type III restriction enzyme